MMQTDNAGATGWWICENDGSRWVSPMQTGTATKAVAFTYFPAAALAALDAQDKEVGR